MKVTTVAIGILAVGVLFLFYHVFITQLQQPKIEIVETRIVPEMSWRPWNWGAGGFGWPGAFYTSRPMPNFYPRTHPDRPEPAHRSMGPVSGPGPQFGGRVGVSHSPSAAVQTLPPTITPH